jgi:CheY-like chemotaxis protein
VLDALNYEVLEATDGIEGVAIALEKKPALILMDLSLPRKDGWEATKEIKAHPDMAKTPIIALTAHAMVGDKEKAIEAGCDDYISKPINLMELNEKIRRYLTKVEKEDNDKKESPAQSNV